MTDSRRVTLETTVDTTGARAGFNEITRQAGTMANAVRETSQRAQAGVSGIGNGASTSARNVEAAQRNLIGSIQRTTAAMEAGGRSSTAYYETLARQRGIDPAILAPYLAQLRAQEELQRRANAGLAGGANQLNRVGASAAQTAAALRGVPAQFTDIITSIQSGQAPMTVLLQQGGQLKDMFGGAGAAAKALGGYVLGLVNPYTIAAAAVGGLAYAHSVGAKESKAYAQSLALSGNAAGSTVDKMSQAAANIRKITGSQGLASEAINALTQSGRVSAKNLEQFATAAIRAQDIIGRSVADTAADFTALGKAPLTALDQVNEKYHFITASTREQVKALVDQGRAAEAANVAQQAYAQGISAQSDKVLKTLSSWEKAWLGIKLYTGDAANAAVDYAGGRQATNAEQINKLLSDREYLQNRYNNAVRLGQSDTKKEYQSQLDLNLNQITNLRNREALAKAAANFEANSVKSAEAKAKWDSDGDKYLNRRQQMERALDVARNEGVAANQSAEVIEKRLSNIRRSFADIYNDGIDSNIEKIKQRAAIEEIFTQRTLALVGAKRNQGSLREEDAIQQTANAELQAFDKRVEYLQKEIALTADKQNSKKAIEALEGQIQQTLELRKNRELQLGYDLFELEQKRTRAGLDNYANLVEQSSQARDAILLQVRDQKDYNEELGKTSLELLNLKAARREEIASRLDKEAYTAEGLDFTGERAAKIRGQAEALRMLTVSEREGFLRQRDPWAGFTDSVRRYGDEASNTGALIGNTMSGAFQSAENAFVGFVTTGKLGFKDLASSILADFARIEAKKGLATLLSLGTNALESYFGISDAQVEMSHSNEMDRILGQLPGRATGGPVTGGQTYLVGERGPEIFRPSGSGTIIPNHQLGGMGGAAPITIITNVTNTGAESSTAGGTGANARAVAEALSAKMKAVIAQEQRQGGLLWNMAQGRG